MRVSTRTLVLIRRRHEAAAVPRLFDDRWSASRVRARRARIDRWMGACVRAVVDEHIESGSLPEGRGRLWSRAGHRVLEREVA